MCTSPAIRTVEIDQTEAQRRASKKVREAPDPCPEPREESARGRRSVMR